MNESLEYIDDYFNKLLPPEENKRFEQRIIDDPAFAEEVAFYCAGLQAAQEQLLEEKKKMFREIYDNKEARQKKQPGMVRRLFPYLAAAAILVCIIVGWFLLSKPTTPQQLADRYIKDNLQNLGVTMSTRSDSIQTGLRLYNDGKLKEALLQFEKIIQSDTSNWEAKKYAGFVSLRLENYDQAISYFQQLESQTGLFANPGYLYHALTLLKRGRPGDTEQAKKLLQEVVQKNLEGKDAAQQLLEKL